MDFAVTSFKLKPIKKKVDKPIQKRGKATYVTKVCKYCNKEFTIPEWYGKGEYCSKTCASLAKKIYNAQCEVCGKKIYRKPSELKRLKHICCSRECMGKLRSIIYSGTNNPNYDNLKEKLKVYDNGHLYYEIRVQNHPYSHISKGFEVYLEHRFIVEQNYKLFDKKYFVNLNGKMYLRTDVDVHHKNEITTDNRIENLQPLTRSEHTTEHNNRKIIIRDTKTGKITGVFKQGELLETHKANDNQQPSIDRNIDKGSTTNSRILASNVEDGNANTSALLDTNSVDDDIV